MNENDYLYLENNEIKYFFESVHVSEMKEKYFDREQVLRACSENNFEIIDEFTPLGNNLDSRYTWFILKFN